MAATTPRTSKRSTPTPAASSTGKESSSTPAPAGPPDTSAAARRLSLPLRDDGSFAVENMHASTRAKLADVLAHPRTAKDFSVSLPAGAEAAGVPALPPVLGGALVQLISGLECLAIQRATHAPDDVIKDIVPYDADERAMIEPSLMAVLNKYGGALTSKYGDEIALVTLLGSLTLAKLAAVRQVMLTRAGTPAPATVPDTSALFAQPAPSAES